MDCFRCNLKVENGKLFGKRLFGKWEIVNPTEIIKIREFAFNNPFIWVYTDTGKYTVGIYRSTYKPVCKYLKENTNLNFEKSVAHKWNDFVFMKPIADILKDIFRKT